MKPETKKFILMTLWGIMAVVLIAAIAWFVHYLLQFKTYQNSQYHFSVAYPKGWLMQEGYAGTVVTFARPKQTALSVFEPNANITVQEVPATTATLASFSAIIIKQMTAVFEKNIEIIEDKDFTFGNRGGHRLIIEAAKPQQLKAVFVWVMKGSFAYIFTYMSRIDQYDAMLPTLNRMVQSFEFK